MSNWISDLDNLAMAGVLDFDAAAFVRGITPRYVGNPQTIPYLPELPTNSFNINPSTDEYISTKKQDNSLVKNSPWKKWAFAGTILAALTYIGCRIAKVKMPTALSNLGTTIGSFFKNVVSKFKKTP